MSDTLLQCPPSPSLTGERPLHKSPRASRSAPSRCSPTVPAAELQGWTEWASSRVLISGAASGSNFSFFLFFGGRGLFWPVHFPLNSPVSSSSSRGRAAIYSVILSEQLLSQHATETPGHQVRGPAVTVLCTKFSAACASADHPPQTLLQHLPVFFLPPWLLSTPIPSLHVLALLSSPPRQHPSPATVSAPFLGNLILSHPAGCHVLLGPPKLMLPVTSSPVSPVTYATPTQLLCAFREHKVKPGLPPTNPLFTRLPPLDK